MWFPAEQLSQKKQDVVFRTQGSTPLWSRKISGTCPCCGMDCSSLSGIRTYASTNGYFVERFEARQCRVKCLGSGETHGFRLWSLWCGSFQWYLVLWCSCRQPGLCGARGDSAAQLRLQYLEKKQQNSTHSHDLWCPAWKLLRKKPFCTVYQGVLITVISVAITAKSGWNLAVDIWGADLYSLGVLTWVNLTKFGTSFSSVIPLDFWKFQFSFLNRVGQGQWSMRSNHLGRIATSHLFITLHNISGGSRGVKTSKVLLSGGLMNVEPPGPPTGRRRLANDFRAHAKDFRLLQKCLDPWRALKDEGSPNFVKENINSSSNKLIDLWEKKCQKMYTWFDTLLSYQMFQWRKIHHRTELLDWAHKNRTFLSWTFNASCESVKMTSWLIQTLCCFMTLCLFSVQLVARL